MNGMLRWFLPLASALLCALSLLTVMKSPDWSPWRLGVVAGEFGHWLAVAALALVLFAWFARGGAGVWAAAVGLPALVATGFFLKPAWQAWRVAAELPARLTASFGAQPVTRPAFSLEGLLNRDPAPVAMRALQVAPGLPLDFYATHRRGAPCVVMIHGGGWESGDRTQLAHVNHWIARQGYAVAAISYRLAPQHRWPAQRDDVLAAIAFLKANAAELSIDPGKLILFGRSAGGQIAQAVAYTAHDPAIRGVAALYAPSDLIFGYVNTYEDDMLKSPALMRRFLGGTPDSARANYESASSIFHVSPHSPPTLLVHGTLDAVSWYRHSERLAAKLKEAGVPHAYVALPWATHGCEFNLHGPSGQLTTFALEWFLAAVTR
ncbi:MAG: alpha/beta hydrolase [Opitutaceae bacterium]|nr:alpha/beta hydrolase [Opitutaceae bacterium]